MGTVTGFLARRAASRRPAGVLLLSAFVLCAACDRNEPCIPRHDPVQTHLAVVGRTDGTIVRTFPFRMGLDDTSAPDLPYARLSLVAGRYLLASTPYTKRLFDLETGQIVATFPEAFDMAHVERVERLYTAVSETGPYYFGGDIAVGHPLNRSAVYALDVGAGGVLDTTLIFAASIRQRDARHFETTRFLKAIPYGSSGSVLYVRETEVTTVTTDSLRTQVYLDRFSFERSLWQYDRATRRHERLVVLPPPLREGKIDHLDATPDGRYLAFDDGGEVYYVDVERRQVRRIGDDSYSSWLSDPIVAPGGRGVLVLSSSCSQVYEYVDFEAGESWSPLSTGYCGTNTAAFSADGRDLYFADNSADTVAVWRTPTETRLWGANGYPSHRRRPVLMFDTLFPDQNHAYLVSVTAPLFLDERTFVVLYAYGGSLYECS